MTSKEFRKACCNEPRTSANDLLRTIESSGITAIEEVAGDTYKLVLAKNGVVVYARYSPSNQKGITINHAYGHLTKQGYITNQHKQSP